MTALDLETRSLLQALYYVSHGIQIPAERASAGLVTVTRDASGQPFEWQLVIDGLFRVHSVKSDQRPQNTHVAVLYKGYWFYIDDADQDTKATFPLLMELSRLELTGKAGQVQCSRCPWVGADLLASPVATEPFTADAGWRRRAACNRFGLRSWCRSSFERVRYRGRAVQAGAPGALVKISARPENRPGTTFEDSRSASNSGCRSCG